MKLARISIAVAVLGLLAGGVAAGNPKRDGPMPCFGSPDCCAACGVRGVCRVRVCQIVSETKKVSKPCWDCEVESFCLPLPNLSCELENLAERLLGHWRSGPSPSATPACSEQCGRCEICRPAAGATCPACASPSGECPPKCGHVRVRKRLMLKEIEIQEPAYKCVVKYLCPQCDRQESSEAK